MRGSGGFGLAGGLLLLLWWLVRVCGWVDEGER